MKWKAGDHAKLSTKTADGLLKEEVVIDEVMDYLIAVRFVDGDIVFPVVPDRLSSV